jgi:hypothetical protein|tara:strand:- start:1628 stop:2230 length:603 start_codon:yes stop_codon:yes gene_type:complete
MALWGKAAAGTQAQKPKWLSTDENSAYKKQDCIGMPGGWAMRAGTAASGNGNTGAQQEVLAAMKGNFGTTLAAPSITSARFVTTAHVTGTPTVTVEVTWDERVTVAGSPTLTLANGNEGSGSGRTCVLTYTATGSTANRKRFTATPTSVTNDVITLGGGSQANIALASGTISDTTVGGTTTAALLVLTALTAQTITVTAS